MKRTIILFFLLIIFGTSCTVYKEYPIDVFKPGEISVPPNVENIALVYRNFKYPNDTMLNYYRANHQLRKAKGDQANLDSVLANICLQELASQLKSKNVYNQISIFTDVFKSHSAEKLAALSPDLVDKLTGSVNADLLVSLELYSSFYSEINDPGEDSREVITAAVWATYDPYSGKIIDRKPMIDTLYWDSYDNQGNYRKNTKLPPRVTALKIAAQMAGENYSKRFFASWENVKRMYSIPPLPDFEAAEKYLLKNEWNNAILLWMRYADEKNGKLAVNARYNLALAYEMKDDIEAAVNWINAARQVALSYKSKEDLKMILKYSQVLETRKKEIEKLNKL